MKEKKPPPGHERKRKPSRTDQARKVAKEHASDQRDIIKKRRKPLH